MDWLQLIGYGVKEICLSPWILAAILSVAGLYVCKRKWLWTSPLLAVCLFVVLAVWRDGLDAVGNGEWRVFALQMWIPAMLIVTGAITGIVVLAEKIWRKQ